MFDQRDSLLGVLQGALSAPMDEEVDYCIERLFRMVQHVSERPAWAVQKEIVMGGSQCGHSVASGACAAAKRLNGGGKTRAMGRFRAATSEYYVCRAG